MDTAAKVTSKGQITIPKVVRDALGLIEGDDVLFRVEGDVALLARTPQFLDLAGSIPVPTSIRDASWDEIVGLSRSSRATHK
jgi:antitoxin PrlF